MRIELATKPYNERRYGRPYIAVVVLKGDRLHPIWGRWIGESGEAGLLVLDHAEAGDVLMVGQRDYRKPANSAPQYYILDKDLKRIPVTKVEAYQHLRSRTECNASNPAVTEMSTEAEDARYDELASFAL